jgi:hypothetical protein
VFGTRDEFACDSQRFICARKIFSHCGLSYRVDFSPRLLHAAHLVARVGRENYRSVTLSLEPIPGSHTK